MPSQPSSPCGTIAAVESNNDKCAFVRKKPASFSSLTGCYEDNQLNLINANWSNISLIKNPSPVVQMEAYLQNPLTKHLIDGQVDELVQFLDEQNPVILRAPLGYPGGKSQPIPMLRELTSTVSVKMVSPFCGGSSFEIVKALDHEQGVECYDAFPALINFYQYAAAGDADLISHVEGIQERVAEAPHSKRLEIFSELKVKAQSAQGIESAASFLAVVMQAFNCVFSSSASSVRLVRFAQSKLNSLRDFVAVAPHLDINWQLGDFQDTITAHSNDFLFLDPPYDLGGSRDNLYGPNGNLHRGFDHDRLAALLKPHDYWLLCYNDCDRVRKLYNDYTILKPSWNYSMGKRTCSEVFILSPRIETELADAANPAYLRLFAESRIPAPANDNQLTR